MLKAQKVSRYRILQGDNKGKKMHIYRITGPAAELKALIKHQKSVGMKEPENEDGSVRFMTMYPSVNKVVELQKTTNGYRLNDEDYEDFIDTVDTLSDNDYVQKVFIDRNIDSAIKSTNTKVAVVDLDDDDDSDDEDTPAPKTTRKKLSAEAD
jgi:hypothetical protein